MNVAEVWMWGQQIGAVAWNEQQQLASFEYTPTFSRKGIEPAPLMMPCSATRNVFAFPELRPRPNATEDAFKGLPGMLADALPDRFGTSLINVWLARQGRPENSLNPVERLCFVGSRGMGALTFKPASQAINSEAERVSIANLVDISRKLLANREQFSTDLRDEESAMESILQVGTSAGGARPKAVIAYNEETKEVRTGQANAPSGFEHWLLKIDGASDVQFGKSSGFGRVEMAYYDMALDAGIQMMPSRLLEENGRGHFMTKRFDRSGGSTRHHIQTLCAMKHYDFNNMLGYSYEQLFQTMRELQLSYAEAEQMYRRMVFNVVAQNCDDHTKNFAFLLKEGSNWQLAPAYDICYAYRKDSLWVSQHALSIGGKRKAFTRKDLTEIGESIGSKSATAILDEIIEVVSGWAKYANKYEVSSSLELEIEDHLLVSSLRSS